MSFTATLNAQLALPVIAAPMFILSQPELVLAQCLNGIVGSFPAMNARPKELLDDWLQAFDPEMAPARADVLARWRSAYGEQGRLLHHSASGCGRCDRTGFKGRAGLHELMTVDRELRRLIQTHARAEDLLRSALAAGMRTLRQDGIEKVLAGLTTIEEVRATSNV